MTKHKQKIVFIHPNGRIHSPAEKTSKIRVQKSLKDVEMIVKRKE
jgi:hypothetical protein